MPRLAIILTMALFLVCASASSVYGMETRDSRDSGTEESEDVSIQVTPDSNPNDETVIGRVVGPSGRSSGRERSQPSPGSECVTAYTIENDLVTPVYTSEGSFLISTLAPRGPLPEGSIQTSRLYSPTGRWVALECGEDDINGFDIPELFPVGGPAVTLGELFDDAMGILDPPVHDYEMRPEGKQLVQLPSLLWVEPAYWDLDRTTTVTNGNLALTLSLVPYETEWDPGDGSTPVVCDGPGDVWSNGIDTENFTCTHTYRTVEGQPFTMSSTVRFEIEWSTNSTETLGPFAPLERVADVEVGVREIQVLETNG